MSESDIAALSLEKDRATIYAGPPIKDIHAFVGTFTLKPPPQSRSRAASTTPVGNLIDGQQTSRDDDIAMSQQPQVAPLTAENLLWANTAGRKEGRLSLFASSMYDAAIGGIYDALVCATTHSANIYKGSKLG